MRSLRTRQAVIALGMFLLTAGRLAAAAENHPFGSRPMTYAVGSITPNHVSSVVQDQAVRDFYDAWKAEYVEQDCGAGRYYVRAEIDNRNLTVSEAHGYGMILAALMAGYDSQARAIFDGMYAYFREHPTATHAGLMSWYQKTSCKDANGNDSASDGDLDIAFALLLADKQWGSCGAIDYLAEATSVLADVKDGDLDTSALYTLLGDWVAPSSTQYYPSTRPSDFMFDHFRSFAAATGDAAWAGLSTSLYSLVDTMQTTYAPATGLLPDFVTDPLGTPAPAPPGFLEGPTDDDYSYNAARTPWRIGTDFLVTGDARAHTAAQRIATWIQTATGGNPSLIRSGYALSGAPLPGSSFLSMAFVAPLGVGAMVDASNQSWLNAVWDQVVAVPLGAEGYYENTLKMLAMIVMSGNWWAPEAVSGGCTSSGSSLCSSPGSLVDGNVTFRKLGGNAGDEALRMKGSLFFAQGIPVTTFADGAQILLEDLGAGSAAVFNLTAATTPIPSSSTTPCDGKDGWKATPRTTRYRNRSGALDPPACTAGSSNGLKKLRYKPRSDFDVDFKLTAKKSAIGPIVGPLQATLVLGDTQAAGNAGACVISPAISCVANSSGRALRCR